MTPKPRREYASPACLLADATAREQEGALRIRTKRVCEPPSRTDGYRVLVDRLWPRGVARDTLRLGAWAKDLAPSTKLRQWFGHSPRKWSEFRRRYRRELAAHPLDLDGLRQHARRRTLTLLYAARDPAHNHALVLKEVLEAGGPPPAR